MCMTGRSITREVLARDRVVAEDLSGQRHGAVVVDQVLVRRVIVVAHDAAVFQMVVEKPVILLAGHPVVQEVFVHRGVDVVAVGEIERQESPFVVQTRACLRTSGPRHESIALIRSG